MDILQRVFRPTSLAVLALVLPGVSAISDRIPVIASAAVALFLLLILIIVIVFATCYAQSWIRASMKRNGKVKMPRSYFDKKREVKRRLTTESVRSSRMTQETNVTQIPPHKPAPIPVHNPAIPQVMAPMDKETFVQGWSQNTQRIYEEKGFNLDMGDENEEEFHIETTIVDNEVLDVGPYKSLGSSGARPVDGNVYANPYIYTNNDRVTVTRSADDTGIVTAANSGSPPPGDATPPQGNGGAPIYSGIDDKVIKF